MHVFRKALTAVVALAAFSGLGAAAAPAQAATYCSTKGQKYVCDYGIATTKFANGTKEEFVVGADHAVWTNWTYPDGSWNGWQSMGAGSRAGSAWTPSSRPARPRSRSQPSVRTATTGSACAIPTGRGPTGG